MLHIFICGILMYAVNVECTTALDSDRNGLYRNIPVHGRKLVKLMSHRAPGKRRQPV